MKIQLIVHYGLWAKAAALIFVGLLLALLPDWGIELRAQTLSPTTSVNFGNVPVGSTTSRTVTFTNDGRYFGELGALPLWTIDISASGAGFSVTGNTCPRGLSQFTVGSSCNITIAFSPVAQGDQNGDLSVSFIGCEGGAPDTPDSSCYSGRTGATLSGVGVAPIDAADDAISTDTETPVTIPVLANDSYTPPVTLEPPTQTTAQGGRAARNADNTITYTPPASFVGTDTFTYTIRDSFQQADPATVTITVRPPQPPVAVNDTASTGVGQPTQPPIAVLANDRYTAPVTVALGTSPSHGSAVVNTADNTITYTPAANFVGTDTFTYIITDRYGQSSAPATVTVRVNPPGPPVAVNDTASTGVGQPTQPPIAVLANDRYAAPVTVALGTSPSHGSAVRNADNTITYTPNPGFASPPNDTFTYTITDRFGQSSAPATVTVTVRPPGLDAMNDTAPPSPARTPVPINVLTNDTYTPPVTVDLGTPPSHGSAERNADNTITYTPAANFAGSDTFTYTIRDNFGQSDSATVRVTVIAPALDAVDDTAPPAQTARPVTIPVLANDVGTGLITITQVSTPAHGSAVAAADGTITYTSAPNYTGSDTFTYTITDGISADSAVVTVTVTRNKEDTQNLLEDTTENPNAKTIGRAIGGLCFDRAASANFLRDCDTLIDAASNGDSGVGPALEQITPDALGIAVDTSLTSVQTQMLNIKSRLTSLRTGVMGINLDRLNIQRGGWTLSGRDLRYLLASLEGGGPSAEVDTNLGALGIFASGTLNLGNKDTTENQTGFDFRTGALTVGADYRFSDQVILGAAFSYSKIDTDIDSNGGYLDNRGYSLTLYGTYYPSDRFYIDGMVNYGWNDYDQQRNVVYQVQNTDVNQQFNSSYSGQQLFVDLGTGYEFTRGNLTFGPELRLSYLDVQVDPFQERADNNNPGSGLAVAIDQQDLQSVVLNVGGRASYLIDQFWGVLQPQVELSWLHEFNDDSRFVQGRFVEGAVVPDNLFQLVTDPVDKNYFMFSLGLSARFNRGPSALIQYRTLFDYANLEEHAITAQLRWEF